jgi:hypothetical protein
MPYELSAPRAAARFEVRGTAWRRSAAGWV